MYFLRGRYCRYALYKKKDDGENEETKLTNRKCTENFLKRIAKKYKKKPRAL